MKQPILLRLLLLYLGALLPGIANAQRTDTLYPGAPGLHTSQLKPGLRQYLVYYQRPQTGKTLWCWYWTRDISVEQREGERVFAIRQQWLGGDTGSYRSYYSVNAAKDFTPVYHCETAHGQISAYNWEAAKISGADTVAGNSKQGFSQSLEKPAFNWNLDIETFEMLPLGADKSFAINFYDAGLAPPKFVLYKVTGSEELSTLDNKKVDCWKLVTVGEFKGAPYSQTFWISKKEHELLKEEDVFGNGYRCKIKLPGLAPDILPHFQ